jgi:hypothetical protein
MLPSSHFHFTLGSYVLKFCFTYRQLCWGLQPFPIDELLVHIPALLAPSGKPYSVLAALMCNVAIIAFPFFAGIER